MTNTTCDISSSARFIGCACGSRYLGTFLDDPVSVPVEVTQTLARQLGISNLDTLRSYGAGKQRWEHAAQIRLNFGYSDPMKLERALI